MKRFLFFTAVMFAFQFSNAQPVIGTWSGDLMIQGMKLPLVLHVHSQGDSLTATLDSPAQGAKGIPVSKVFFSNNELQFEIKMIQASYKGMLAADSIAGTFTQMGMNLPLTFKKGAAKPANRPQTPKPPFNYQIEEVNFTNPADTNTLAGTLTTLMDKKQFPVVVLITGSGDQDRDETLFDHKPFWVIADHLTKNGIGVLRLDDRGVGGSTKGKEASTTASFATDIDAAVKFLTKRGYKNIGLIGHSEGGMIAPMVADKNKNVKFLISLAGPGVDIYDLMLKQTFDVTKSSGVSDSAAQAATEQNKKIFAFIKDYKGNNLGKDAKVFLNSLPETDALKTLTPEQKQTIIDQQVKMITSPWFQYFLKFSPQAYITKLKIPVLAINGSKDIQVSAKENLAGWKQGLEKAGNNNYKIVELPDMNHLFQKAGTGTVAEYGQIEETISPEVLNLMTSWILKLK